MIIHSFDPLLDIPYYYPCNFPLIHEVLQRQGSMSSLAMLAASRLYTLPSCEDNGSVKTYFHKLDYDEPIWQMNDQRELGSFEEGIMQILRQLEAGRLFLATGTSYHLPYCDDYHNPEYINKHVKPSSRHYLVDHWLAVYGMDEDHMYVYDPVFYKFKGKVEHAAFHDFWRGHPAIPELAGVKQREVLRTYGATDIQSKVLLDSQGYQEMLAQALTTQVHEFLTGRTVTEGSRRFYFGHAVSTSLVDALEGKTESNTENEARISSLLFDMRWSRYYFRDVLKESARWLGAPLGQYAKEYEHIILRWEKANNLLQVGRMKQREGWQAQLSGVVQGLIADEWHWYESFRRALPQAPTFSKQSRAVLDNENEHKAALIRIVLDSCRELNAYHNTFIALDEGANAPLYGRDGRLNSLELVSLLAVVEQAIEEHWGKGLGNALAEIAAASLPESPYRTVGSLVNYIAQQQTLVSDEGGCEVIDFLLERFAAHGQHPAFIWEDREYSYDWLLDQIFLVGQWIEKEGISGRIVTLEEDYSPYAASAMLALLGARCIVLPIDRNLVEAKRNEYVKLAHVAVRLGIEAGMLLVRQVCKSHEEEAMPSILTELEHEQVGGLVLFSSGSTGVSKATVHRADRLLQSFRRQVRPLRTIPFMMFDHIGGVNTMLQSLSSGGCLCIVANRTPKEVCRTIEKHRVQALPVSPTFMNLLLLGKQDESYDLSSLEVVSYGSEVMPESVLASWNRRFPRIRTIQAYGMSELGILPTRSKEPGSLLFSIQDEEVKYRVVDGELQIRAATAMMGYLNAPSPFTEDGWLRTGDEAVVEQGYIRILGRRSEIINVGGWKVYPAEVEGVLEEMDGIEAAVVTGEVSGITGQQVKVTVRLASPCSLAELRRAIWAYCRDKLPAYKIPQKIVITEEALVSSRMKKGQKARMIAAGSWIVESN